MPEKRSFNYKLYWENSKAIILNGQLETQLPGKNSANDESQPSKAVA
jgi:hypothetical protein